MLTYYFILVRHKLILRWRKMEIHSTTLGSKTEKVLRSRGLRKGQVKKGRGKKRVQGGIFFLCPQPMVSNMREDLKLSFFILILHSYKVFYFMQSQISKMITSQLCLMDNNYLKKSTTLRSFHISHHNM